MMVTWQPKLTTDRIRDKKIILESMLNISIIKSNQNLTSKPNPFFNYFSNDNVQFHHDIDSNQHPNCCSDGLLQVQSVEDMPLNVDKNEKEETGLSISEPELPTILNEIDK